MGIFQGVFIDSLKYIARAGCARTSYALGAAMAMGVFQGVFMDSPKYIARADRARTLYALGAAMGVFQGYPWTP
jgi:hypothetical protein